ncbi:hypothetical protein [Hydrogenophaga sp.]|uniref:hypothetical protein n=1 Tax=Hydrogenophaga sp. TaxID=1904254 RepID=UPI002726C96F|nr:hypothetical protein [Hydrogenophaga sp.]MDO9504779.1 hypothetical protein [Hydrogenophaga sp.]
MNTDRDDQVLPERLPADDAERYLQFVAIVGDLHTGQDSRIASDRLCRLAIEAYPPSQLGDAEILANPLTPVLMRFFVASLKRYSDDLRELEISKPAARSTTNERAKVVARAFQFIGRSGKPASKFTDEDCQSYLKAFAHHFHDSVSGRTVAAYDKGLKAVYARFREREENPQGGQNEFDKFKTLERLRTFLKRHGYRRPAQRATLPP